MLRIKAEAFDRSDKDSEARTARMIQDVKKEAKDGEDGMG